MSKPQPVATNFYPPIYRVCLVRERDTSVYLDQFSDPKVAYAWAREALFSTSDREELWILALTWFPWVASACQLYILGKYLSRWCCALPLPVSFFIIIRREIRGRLRKMRALLSG